MMFCKHKWEVLSEKMTESKAEQIQRLKFDGGVKLEGSGPFQRKYICIVACEKCGKMRRIVEDC